MRTTHTTLVAVIITALTAATIIAAQASAQDAEAPPKTRYLLIGDSMVWELGLALEPLIEAQGHDFRYKHKTSDSIRSHAANNRMRDGIRKYKPDVILISLGANEALIPKPDVLIKPIGKIVGQIGDTPCYWIGPPMWTQDTGVVKVLEEHAAPCTFFNSSDLELDRRRDGYHPNKAGAKVWADAITAFLAQTPPKDTP